MNLGLHARQTLDQLSLFISFCSVPFSYFSTSFSLKLMNYSPNLSALNNIHFNIPSDLSTNAPNPPLKEVGVLENTVFVVVNSSGWNDLSSFPRVSL